MKKALLCLLLGSPVLAPAQALRPGEARTLSVLPGRAETVRYDQPYTSALIRWPAGQSLSGTYLIAAGDTLLLQAEPHPAADQPASALCVFRRPVSQITLLPGKLTGNLTLQTIYVPPLPAGYVRAQMDILAKSGARADCAKPDVVPVSVWRKGLTPPKEPPVATKVQFVIVHHSAGSNTLTDYTEEVRNIYAFHTQSNGWNDVGYNFLIGRDGQIYEGRDGRGVMDGDNVLGAHFCGQNSGTMGICVMGNFTDAQPTDASLAALDKLVGWKLKKEGLLPGDVGRHAGSGNQLGRIAAHRNGSCATECPGSALYARLPAIRQAVSESCSFTAAEPTPLATEQTGADWVVYPNPGRGTIYVAHKTTDAAAVAFDLIDGAGRRWAVASARVAPDRWRIEAPVHGHGRYWLRCRDGDALTFRQLWLDQN